MADDVTVPLSAAKLAHRALRERWVWYTKHGHAVPRELDEALRAIAAAIGFAPPATPFHGLTDRQW